jgi:hypothetical protein
MLSLRRQIGRLLIAGFDGPQMPVELKALTREFGLGGVILFARNIEEPEQVAELSFEAAGLVPDFPLWVSVDQEGGRVARLKAPFTEWPAAATLGRSGDIALAERFARALAAELRAIEESGVFTNYGPTNTRFEEALTSQLFDNVGGCVTVNNATIGLMLAIRECITDTQTRRYAILPSFTFAATAQAVLWAGLTPLLCDIDPYTWLPSAAAEEELLDRYAQRWRPTEFSACVSTSISACAVASFNISTWL